MLIFMSYLQMDNNSQLYFSILESFLIIYIQLCKGFYVINYNYRLQKCYLIEEKSRNKIKVSTPLKTTMDSAVTADSANSF